jgi:hypothetical protein
MFIKPIAFFLLMAGCGHAMAASNCPHKFLGGDTIDYWAHGIACLDVSGAGFTSGSTSTPGLGYIIEMDFGNDGFLDEIVYLPGIGVRIDSGFSDVVFVGGTIQTVVEGNVFHNASDDYTPVPVGGGSDGGDDGFCIPGPDDFGNIIICEI